MALFHFTQQRLRPGSIIEPGNWGRLLRRYGSDQRGQFFGEPWLLARELLFELIRIECAPRAPSRFEACFSLLSAEEAQRYRQKTDGFSRQVLHEVELVDPDLATHRGVIDLLDIHFAQIGTFLEPMSSRARDYWSGVGTGDFELVSASALRVIACLE